MSTESSTPANAGRHDASGVRRVPDASAQSELSRTLVLTVSGIIVAALFLIDQFTKNWAEAHLSQDSSEPLIGTLLQLRLLYNSGAAWGLGAGITPVVTAVQIVIASVVVYLLIQRVRRGSWMIALSLILGGAVGNIHDRLLRAPGFFRGYVVDFLELPNWPIFNVADMAIVAGALLVMILSFLGTPISAADLSASDSSAHSRASHTAAKGKRS